jgi:hypothetical protein
MAFAVNIQPVDATQFVPEHWVVTVEETGAVPGDEWSTAAAGNVLPQVGRISLYEATKDPGGGGTTIQPALGKEAAFTVPSQSGIGQQTVASAYINDGSQLLYTLPEGSGVIYGRSTLDAGVSDISTTFTVFRGHR